MSTPSTIDLLNRLLVLHARSLPMYLSYAQPDRLDSRPEAKAVFKQIVADHQRTVDRLSLLILDSNGLTSPGEWPMAFTGLHDLSVDYLLKLLVERQQRFVPACERLAEQLRMAPYAQAVAREIVGEAKGHLENLEELVEKAAA